MRPSDREVAGTIVAFERAAGLTLPLATRTGERGTDEDVDAGTAGADLRVGIEPVDPLQRPRLEHAGRGVAAVVQVDARDPVAREDEADAGEVRRRGQR